MDEEYTDREMNASEEYEESAPETGNMASPIPPDPVPKKKKKQSMGVGGVVAVAVICAVLGGIIGAGAFYGIARLLTGSTSAEVLVSSRQTVDVIEVPADTGDELTAAQVYAKNVAATVGITTTTTTNFWGYQTTSAASGSGFFVTTDGYVVTCYHVVEDSDTITVTDYAGNTYEAELVGYNENKDVAVLKADAEDVQAVTLGSSDDLHVGDEVVAIGNPLGELTFSLTAGAVSALDRSITVSESNTTMTLIQTDCAINSGNSGGALFNMYGEVIGITNAKYSGSGSSSEASIDNIGFAIPMSQVKNVIESIIEDGTYETPYIGVTVSDVTMDAAAETGVTAGAVIQDVTSGSPAAQAGLQAGDVIVAVDGEEISGSSDLVAIVQKASVGDQLVLTVNRSREEMEITVTIGAQSQTAIPETSADVSGSDGSDSYGYGYSYPWGNYYGNNR